MSFSIFLPLRSGSTRVPHKNTRAFLSDGTSLFQYKMSQLVELLGDVDEIVVSTDDREVIEQAKEFSHDKIKVIIRPKELCLSTTKIDDLMDYIPTVVAGEHIFWTHVTEPFVNAQDYKDALSCYSKNVLNGEYDSVMSVTKLQQFIYDNRSKRIINNSGENRWPNTQELTPLYEINHAFYIYSKEMYKKVRDRVGMNPFLYELEGMKTMDIDWPSDFELASKLARVLDLEG
jgi:N-acylneuraminate cytidylyltransferase